MLGRVRPPSSSSLECLELEREEPSKLTKHDSLSIYEATLVKLRKGARCDLTSIPEQKIKTAIDSGSTTDSPREDVMAIDTNSSSCSVILSSSSESWPMSSSNKTMSLKYMFERYKSSQQTPKSPDETLMLESDCSSCLSSLSPVLSD